MIEDDSVRDVFAGVDTHALTHHGAVVDALGRALATRSFLPIPVARLPCWGGFARSGFSGPRVSKGRARTAPS